MKKRLFPSRRPFSGVTGPLVGLFLLVALASACSQGLTPGNPALPPGFQEALLPEMDLNGYVYFSQGQPVSIANSYFMGGSRAQLAADAPQESQVDHVTVWLGDSTDRYAGKLGLSRETDLDFISRLLDEEGIFYFSEDSEEGETELYVVHGDEPWRQTIQSAVTQGSLGTLEARYPDVWEIVRLLPENPPLAPVAAGFLNVKAVLEDILARRGEVNAQGVTSAMGALRVEKAAFAIYSDKPVAIPGTISQDFLRETDLAAVFVAPSGYPGFLLGFLFSNFAGQAELTKVSLGENGGEAYYRELNGLHLFVQNAGSTVVFAVASKHDTAMAAIRNIR